MKIIKQLNQNWVKKAFKMGASSLKIKKFRLTLTIFLSFLAFMMFGLANTMSSYDNIKTTVNSIVDSNIDMQLLKNKKFFPMVKEIMIFI